MACSPFVEITKEVMGRTGTLEDGVTFPHNIRLSIPISTFTSSENERVLWKRPTMKVMHRSRVKNGENLTSELGPWRDISSKNKMLFNPVLIQKGEERLVLDTPLPCQVMALVFDETSKEVQASSRDVQSTSKELSVKDSEGSAIEIQSKSKDALDSLNELTSVCEKLKENNEVYDAAIMLHQKTDHPTTISKLMHLKVAPPRSSSRGGNKATVMKMENSTLPGPTSCPCAMNPQQRALLAESRIIDHVPHFTTAKYSCFTFALAFYFLFV